jgi:16S rRNA (uracil1498-N3)-methyltransferase
MWPRHGCRVVAPVRLSPAEDEAARGAGFTAVQLGPRVLRAETAPLAALAWLGLS